MEEMREMFGHVWLAVVAGGKGTRLFPISHEGRPKQFCDLNQSEKFIQATIKRFLRLGIKPTQVVVITTNANQASLAKQQVKELGVLSQNIYKEEDWGYPGVMIKATEIIAKLDPEAIIINTPSDQHLVDDDRFKGSITSSIELAQDGKFAVVGVRVTDLVTATGCGHVVFDPKETPMLGFRKMLDFCEKPDEALADKLMRSNSSACNTGINTWRADALLDTITPDKVKLAEAEAKERGLKYELTTDAFLKMFSSRIYVTAQDFPWYDCGTLNAMYEISPKTPSRRNANIGGGKVDSTDCIGSLFYAPDGFRLYATGFSGVCGAVNIIQINGVMHPICCIVRLSDSQSVKELAEDIMASRHVLSADFQINARNNTIMRSNISSEMIFGFVGVENCIVNAFKNPDGVFDVYISQQTSNVH